MADAIRGRRFFGMIRGEPNPADPTTPKPRAGKSIKLKLGFRSAIAYELSCHIMFTLNPYSILAGFIFSTIGLGAFSYGRKLELWQPRVIGLALMVYPYFTSNEWLLWGVGVGLLVLLWFYHHE
jgi:hypothetical protein